MENIHKLPLVLSAVSLLLCYAGCVSSDLTASAGSFELEVNITEESQALHYQHFLDKYQTQVQVKGDAFQANQTALVTVSTPRIFRVFLRLCQKFNNTVRIVKFDLDKSLSALIGVWKGQKVNWSEATSSGYWLITNGALQEPVDKYLSYIEIVEWMVLMTLMGKANLRAYGKSAEGRPLLALEMTHRVPHLRRPAPGILLESGIHAREWLAPAALMVAASKIINNNLLSEFNVYVVPLSNPDGYDFTYQALEGAKKGMLTFFDRYWRRSRRVLRAKCIGVDLNRNFDFKFDPQLLNRPSCSDFSSSFPGDLPFSEPESRGLAYLIRNYANDVAPLTVTNASPSARKSRKLLAYLSLHSYGQKILYPYSFVSSPLILPDNLEQLKQAAREMASSILAVNNATYEVGTVPEVMKINATGSSIDWAHHFGIPFTFAVELKPTTDELEVYGFHPSPKLIQPTGEDVVAAVVALGNFILQGEN